MRMMFFTKPRMYLRKDPDAGWTLALWKLRVLFNVRRTGEAMIDLLLHNLRTIGTHHCDGTVGEEAADEIERLRAEVAGLRECAIDLWMMLDDIDTGGDRAKADDVLYRAIAERTHRRRFSPKYQIVIDAIDAARKGEATTPPPSPSPRS